MSGEWATHREESTAHYLFGPTGTAGPPYAYATACGSLSGSYGWHLADSSDKRCSNCRAMLARAEGERAIGDGAD
jgi:hypothetical protein